MYYNENMLLRPEIPNSKQENDELQLNYDEYYERLRNEDMERYKKLRAENDEYCEKMRSKREHSKQ